MASMWDGIAPIRPRQAEVELGFLFLDMAHDEEPSNERYLEKLNKIINGLYLAGWRDAREEIYRSILSAE